MQAYMNDGAVLGGARQEEVEMRQAGRSAQLLRIASDS